MGRSRIGFSVRNGMRGSTSNPFGIETTTKLGDPPPLAVSQPVTEQSQATRQTGLGIVAFDADA